MANLESKIAFFRIELSQQNEITRDLIRKAVESGPFQLNDEDKDEIIRLLEHSFDVTQRVGASLKSSDYAPWLAERKVGQRIDFYYWNRLKRYYLEKGILPPNVVATLDSVTDEVLDYSGNPEIEETWARRGMVLGHVQSGKTTNYSSLICKGADAGYKIIILLAGITNSLRRQTQERLDETFIGKKSVFQSIASETMSIIHFAEPHRFPVYGTTRDRDFLKDAAENYGVSISSLKEPLIFITKKNKTTLERLRDWLKEQNLSKPILDPLLLIDDEADNASINTESDPKRVTAINGAIRQILNMFERSTYVGYTATPFANIFIDPESENEMLQDDLFPRHFIKALDPPSNYVGAIRVFRENGDLRDTMVKVIDDYSQILPLKHKKSDPVLDIPGTLKTALRVFVLTRAIRVLRGDGNKSCSMMINVSRFNDIQDVVSGLVYQYLEVLKHSIVVSSGLGSKATEDTNINNLETDFNREFSKLEFTFSQILKALPEAVVSITTRIINMRGGVLDYSQHSKMGLHVIAIGGLALSRGLTLEGLTVSYILRNASASDTLMQMARWFGYRPRYEDICRLYIPQTSLDHYDFITEAIEELRGEIIRMEQLQMTPNDFGLRVRHDPTAIRITAANKMRTATQIKVAQDYSGRHIEGYALYNSDEINSQNILHIKGLIQKLGSAKPSSKKTLIWEAPGELVFDLVRNFRFPEAHADLGYITGTRSLLQDYFSDRLSSDLSQWDVAIPLAEVGGEQVSDFIQGSVLHVRRREAGLVQNGVYKVTGKNRLANPGDEQIALGPNEIDAAKAAIADGEAERGYCTFSRFRTKPLILIHLFVGSLKEPWHEPLKISSPIVSLSFCLPLTSVPAVERIYQVNSVYRKQMLENASEPEDDDALLEGDLNV